MFATSVVIAAVAFFATFVAAQSSTIDPSTIPIGLRTTWCNAQFNTCNILCDQSTASDGCNPTNLDFNCTCASNNSAPGLAFYLQTIPTFLCIQTFQNCIAANTQNSTAQQECTDAKNADCGDLDPASGAAVSSSGSPSSTASSGTNAASTSAASSNTAASTSAPVSSSSSSAGAAATMLALGREYGSGVIAAGIAAAVML